MGKSVLKDIGMYKTNLIENLLTSSDILELMLGEDYAQTAAKNIVYSQIFPYLYVDDTQTEVKSYLCIEVDMPTIPSGTIKNMEVTIWAYCHKNCMKYLKKDYIGTRADILADMVERKIREFDPMGIGEMHLESVKRLFPNTKYYGKQLIFETPDFKIKGG